MQHYQYWREVIFSLYEFFDEAIWKIAFQNMEKNVL